MASKVRLPGREAVVGRLAFLDNEVSTGTGTLRARAQVANPRGELVPGMYGQVEVIFGHTPEALLVDETAVGTDAQGVDPEMAQVEVQNRVSRALPRLPQEVQRIGVVTQKTSPDMLMVIHLVSPGERYDLLHLYNFAVLQVKDELLRTEGVGEVFTWGAGDYSLRVWVDPNRLAARGMTPGDVVGGAARAERAGRGRCPRPAAARQRSLPALRPRARPTGEPR